MSTRQKREYFRQDCEAILHVTRIENQHEETAVANFQQNSESGSSLASKFAASSRETESLLKRISAQTPDVASYLSALNNKVELLARMMLKRDAENGAAAPRHIDLSAKGIGFNNEVELPVGTLVKMRLILLPNYTGIDLLSRVMHCSPQSSSKGFSIGTLIEHIDEGDRELIIHFVLDRQAAELRQRRTALDGEA